MLVVMYLGSKVGSVRTGGVSVMLSKIVHNLIYVSGEGKFLIGTRARLHSNRIQRSSSQLTRNPYKHDTLQFHKVRNLKYM